MTPPRLNRFATPFATLALTLLVAFATVASGSGQTEDCHGNSPKHPCPVLEPSDGATVNGTVTAQARVDDTSVVAGVQFKVDGTNLGLEDTVAPYELPWDTTSTSNGGHALTATVRDLHGDLTTKRNDVTVANPVPDTTPPSGQVTAPAGGSTVSGTVSVAADASDNVGVAGVRFKLDGADLGAEDTSAPYEVSWDTTKNSNTQHALTAVVRDAAGNTSTTPPSSVTVKNAASTPDTTPPSVQLTAPSGGVTVNATVGVSANATDNVGVAGVQFKLDGANLGSEDTSAPYSVAWDTTKSTNALHVLTAVARDAAGNSAAGVAVSVTVLNVASDTTPPTAQMTAPADGSTVNSSVTITAGASDNVGVAGVQFRLDGANLGAEDTTAPYSAAWDTTRSANGGHHLTAVARDGAGNTATTAATSVTVSNPTSTPTSSSLRWPAPTLTSPQTIVIPERGGETWSLTAGKDYIVKFETGRRYGPLRFWGGRNIVLVGGEQIIDDTTSTDYRARRLLEFRDQTGTIHIEGYLGYGAGLTEGINIWAPEAVIQIQKSRIENIHGMSNNPDQHPDIIQTWSGPKELRMWRFSGSTDYQGFLFMRDSGGVYPGSVTLEDVNIRPLPNPAWGGKGYGIGAIWLLSASTEFKLRNVWVETGWWNGTYHKSLKDSLGFRAPDVTAPCWSWQEYRASGTTYGGEHISEPCNSGTSYSNQQGDWLEFVRASTDNIWNGDKSGRGRVYQGVPSGGDFASASTVGRNYTP